MKLFAIYIGGELEDANIELHDMRFVLAPSITETYAEFRRQWWGVPKSLVERSHLYSNQSLDRLSSGDATVDANELFRKRNVQH